MQVAFGMDDEVHLSVAGYLLEHVVEEAEAGADVGLARAVEGDADADVRFLGGAGDVGGALAVEDLLGGLLPGGVVVQNDGLAPDVLGKEGIGIAVADDITVGKVIVGIVHVFLYQACLGLAGGRVVCGEMGVDEDVVEGDAFAAQCLEDEIVRGPEGVFGKGIGAKTVLVAYHDEKEVGFFAEKRQPSEDAGLEPYLLQGIYLLVVRLFDECAVAVNK